MNKIILITIGVLVIFASISFGAFGLWSDSDLNFNDRLNIILQLRVPRVVSSLLIGAILSCCGLVMQTLLRNPLACPYTLGVSQVVALLFFSALYLSAVMQVFLVIFLLSIFLLVVITRKGTDFSPATIILAGLALGSFCSSLILALQFTLDGISLLQISRWLMGSLSVSGYSSLCFLATVAIALAVVLRVFRKDLDSLLLGPEIALSRGVPVRSVNLVLHLTIICCVAAVVWYAGPVGFVGLVIPHCIRLLGIRGHAFQSVYCAFAGGIFLCFCDLLSRLAFAPVELPIGVVTGLIGAPCFIVLLLKD